MSIKTVVHEDETFDMAFRRWKRSVSKSGVLIECKKHENYLKKSLRRKQKALLARRKK